MSIPVRQSTAYEFSIGPVLDADGVAFTGAVVGDFKIKKTTGDYAALNGSATAAHTHAGHYDIVLTTSDTDTVGAATVAIDDGVNTCLPVRFQVIEEAVYDMLYAASALGYVANAPVNVAQFGGTNGTFASGRPEVNTTHLAGSSTTLSQLISANISYAGTASSGSTTTLVDAGLTQGDDYWVDSWVLFTSGNNITQCRRITAFTASSDTVTFWPPVANSVTTHSYVIIPAATARAVLAADIAHGGGTASLTLQDLTVTGEFAMNTLVVAAGASFNLTGNITGNLSGSVGSVTAAITLPTIPTNWITADGIAEDAIGASELASDVFSSITSSVWGAATRVLTAGTNIQLPSNGLANVTAWTVALTGNITGNLSGSVGSVTGNVGGNVVGTVASVVGAVGSVTAGVNLADGAITDAKFTIPTLTGPASGPVGMLVQLWRRFFKKVTRDSDEIKTYADNGSTVVTTQTYTASGSDEDVGAAS